MSNTVKSLITRKRFKSIDDIERKCIVYNVLGLITDEELESLIIYAREVYAV